jgi:uncharacterized membrane protein YkoI
MGRSSGVQLSAFILVRMRNLFLPLAIGAFSILALPLVPVAAGDDKSDHDRARAALKRGEVLPLRDIVARAEAAFPGRLLEVELEDEDGQIVYDIELLSPDGRLIELLYDARTGTLLKAKGAGLKELKRDAEKD